MKNNSQNSSTQYLPRITISTKVLVGLLRLSAEALDEAYKRGGPAEQEVTFDEGVSLLQFLRFCLAAHPDRDLAKHFVALLNDAKQKGSKP